MSKTDLEKNGAAQAAMLAAAFGVLTLAAVNVGTEVSEVFKTRVHDVGKALVPGAEGIGPYSGKEAISLAVWLLSWWALHRFFRAKELPAATFMALFLILVALATTLVWPPVTHLFVPKG